MLNVFKQTFTVTTTTDEYLSVNNLLQFYNDKLIKVGLRLFMKNNDQERYFKPSKSVAVELSTACI